MSRGERWLKTIRGLAEHQLKASYAQAELFEGSLLEVADGLNWICDRAETMVVAARDVLSAFVPTIIDVRHLPRVGSLRTTAIAESMPSLNRLLRCSTPEGHFVGRQSKAGEDKVMLRPDGDPYSLGERRSFARKPSRNMLEKLMRDPHPLVVQRVLVNPRLTEDDVVVMAAQRPVQHHVMLEIALLWSRSIRVRMAIALNPHTPPAVAVPLLGMMARPGLAEVMGAADLAPSVRATARELYDLRPPLAEQEKPKWPH